jgi:hypothetical protein
VCNISIFVLTKIFFDGIRNKCFISVDSEHF